MKRRLEVDIIACDGRGLCAELLPELVRLDDWGYPIIDAQPFDERLLPLVKRAEAACPVLALRIVEVRS
jgi:ferredoxin